MTEKFNGDIDEPLYKPTLAMSTPVFRLPASTSLTPEQALQYALQDNLQDVLVIGYDQEGELVIISSRLTCAEAAFLANKAFNWAQNGGQK